MQSVVGIFASSGDACRALDAATKVVRPGRVTILMPDTPGAEIERRVPSEPGEGPGMGAALGGVVGGASGLSVAALALPGVGPIVVAGLLAAGLVGTAGGVIGQALEERLTSGLSREELQFYETQLRRGRSVVIALAADDGEAVAAREAFEESGALTIDAARDWGTGLRETLL